MPCFLFSSFFLLFEFFINLWGEPKTIHTVPERKIKGYRNVPNHEAVDDTNK